MNPGLLQTQYSMERMRQHSHGTLSPAIHVIWLHENSVPSMSFGYRSTSCWADIWLRPNLRPLVLVSNACLECLFFSLCWRMRELSKCVSYWCYGSTALAVFRGKVLFFVCTADTVSGKIYLLAWVILS